MKTQFTKEEFESGNIQTKQNKENLTFILLVAK